VIQVFDEPELFGRDANVEAWRGYCRSWPDYLIYLQAIGDPGRGRVGLVGTSTGSHLELPDEEMEEMMITLIWLAEVDDEGRLTRWQVCEDTPARRAELALPGLGGR
jgi:hypothetical protein